MGGVMAVLVVPSLLFPVATRAAAVGPDAVGWWSEAQQAPSPLPIDAVTGKNLEVGADPTGPNAIAAVRYAVPGTIDGVPVDPAAVAATLTLRVASNSTVGTPAVVACPVVGTWQPATAGTWAARPAYNCGSSAAGNLSADKAAMTFRLDPSMQLQPGTYDVALVAAPSNQTPFSMQFQPPAGDSAAFGPVVAGPAFAGLAAPAGELPAPAGAHNNAMSPQGAASSLAVGASVPVSPPAGVEAPLRPVPLRGPSHLLPGPLRRAVSPSRSQQAIALAVLVAMAAALWWFGGEQTRAPRLLGSLGEGVPAEGPEVYVRSGGIGRFARPRTGPPVRL